MPEPDHTADPDQKMVDTYAAELGVDQRTARVLVQNAGTIAWLQRYRRGEVTYTPSKIGPDGRRVTNKERRAAR